MNIRLWCEIHNDAALSYVPYINNDNLELIVGSCERCEDKRKEEKLRDPDVLLDVEIDIITEYLKIKSVSKGGVIAIAAWELLLVLHGNDIPRVVWDDKFNQAWLLQQKWNDREPAINIEYPLLYDQPQHLDEFEKDIHFSDVINIEAAKQILRTYRASKLDNLRVKHERRN